MTPEPMASHLDDDIDIVPLASLQDAAGGRDADTLAADAATVAIPPEVAWHQGTLVPGGGWRRALWEVSGHRVGLVTGRERHLAERIAVLRRALGGPWAIALLSMKGGVGKTTTCVGVGHVFASQRADHVIAADFNPSGGGLVQRVGQETSATISDLLASTSRFERMAEMRAFTTEAPSGLQVLAANRDPWAAAALDADLFRRTRAILGIHYGVILLDCGPGLFSEAVRAAVEVADQVVVVASAAFDAGEVSYRTLEWLERFGHGYLVREAVVVINTLEDDRRIRVDVMERAFGEHCRAVIRVPRDPHLRLGTRIELGEVRRETWDAWVELAATLAEGFRL